MEKRTRIEAFSPSGNRESIFEVFHIRPAIVDSSFLLPDLFWTARNLTQSTFLDSIDFGVVRAFAAHHIWAEIPRKIEEDASNSQLDRKTVEGIWWNEYVPRIRFVDVGGLAVPCASRISERDASDAPTFALAGLLAPVVVLAPDHDVTDLGIASTDWLAVVRAGDELTFAASGAMTGLFGMNLSGYSLGAAAKGIWRIAQHPAGQLGLAAAAVCGAITFRRWWPSARTKASGFGGALSNFSELVTPVVEAIGAQYQAASAVWNEAAYSSDALTLSQRTARILATSPGPISRTAITKILLPGESERARRRLGLELGPVLSSGPAFVSSSDRRWQLGKPAPNFGMDDLEAPMLSERSAIPTVLAERIKASSRSSSSAA